MITKQKTKSSVNNLLKNYHIKPLKKFGQNFLMEKSIVNKLIKTGDLKKNDIILEIGPGTGILTKEIAERVKKVIAVEKDVKMCQILRQELKGFDNIEIIQTDILSYKLQVTNYKIISNLPFYLTAVAIRKFLEEKNPPKEMVLIVQKEVAQRICSKPPQMNLLAVAVQFYAEPKIIDYVSKKSFWPEPEVDGAIIKLKIKNLPEKTGIPDKSGKKSKADHEQFFRIVKAGFSHPRKTLLNNLSNGLKLKKNEVQQWLNKNNIKPSQRAESLSLQDWIDLTKTFML